jgi:hypothetical protein
LVRQLLELDLDLGVVFITAGWYGILATLLLESGVKLEKIRSFDINDHCWAIAEIINQPWVQDGWKFKASTTDIQDINYRVAEYIVARSDGSITKLTDMPDTIINTSCEHIIEFDRWWNLVPDGVLTIVQSNDLDELDEHVNCCQDLDDFASRTPMSELLYEGELDLGSFKRFMRIGYR